MFYLESRALICLVQLSSENVRQSTTCFYQPNAFNVRITAPTQKMCVVITAVSPGVLPSVSHYLLESCRESLLMASHTVESGLYCPRGLLYHLSSEGHIFTLKNNPKHFRVKKVFSWGKKHK